MVNRTNKKPILQNKFLVLLTTLFFIVFLLLWTKNTRNGSSITASDCTDTFEELKNDKIGVHENQLYIAVVTGRREMKVRAKLAHDAWLQHFKPSNNFVFTSPPTKHDEDISNLFTHATVISVPDSVDDYWAAQYRFVYGMKYLLDVANSRNDNNVRWFLIADDDTFIIPRNLFRLLAKLSLQYKHEIPSFFGNCNYPRTDRFLGGAGVLITKPALQLYFDNYHKCSVQIEMQKYQQYYDIVVPDCYYEILQEKKLSYEVCTHVEELYARRFEDKCSYRHMPHIQFQPNGFGKNLQNTASVHFYKDKNEVQSMLSMFPRDYFEVKRCVTHYFDRKELLTHKFDANARAMEKTPRVEIEVHRLQTGSDEEIVKEMILRSKKPWHVFVLKSTCVDLGSALPRLLSQFTETEPLFIVGDASPTDLAKERITIGAGFILSRTFITNTLGNCKEGACVKDVLNRLRSFKDHKVIHGSILEEHPLDYCSKSGMYHTDTKYPFNKEEIAIFPPYRNLNGSLVCNPPLFVRGVSVQS
jgi:hypothetical protein